MMANAREIVIDEAYDITRLDFDALAPLVFCAAATTAVGSL